MSFLLRKSGQSKWGDLLSECESVSARLLETVSADVLSVQAESVAHGFSSKSTIGLMITGLLVDNTVVGGPAYACQQLQKGDEIVQVDAKAVTAGDSVSKALLGSDTPGSIVTISLKKKGTGAVKSVKLRRIASEELADRRAMFELFTYMKQRAIKDADKALGQGVDKCIELWTRMCIAESNHSKRIQANVESLKKSCEAELKILGQLLSRLHLEFSALQVAGQSPVKQEKFDSMTLALAEAKQGLEAAENLLGEKEDELLQLRERLAEKHRELQEIKQQQGSRDGDLNKLQGLVEMADEDCKRVHMHILSKEETIRQKDVDIQGWRRDLNILEQQVRDKMEEAIRQQRDVQARDSELERMKKELVSSDETLAATMQNLKEHEMLLDAARKKIQENDNEIVRLQMQLNSVQDHLVLAQEYHIDQEKTISLAQSRTLQANVELADAHSKMKELRHHLDRLDSSRRATESTLLHESQRADRAEQSVAKREVEILGLTQQITDLQGKLSESKRDAETRLSESNKKLITAEKSLEARMKETKSECLNCSRLKMELAAERKAAVEKKRKAVTSPPPKSLPVGASAWAVAQQVATSAKAKVSVPPCMLVEMPFVAVLVIVWVAMMTIMVAILLRIATISDSFGGGAGAVAAAQDRGCR